MAAAGPRTDAERLARAAILLLLAATTVAFIVTGRATEAVESSAWYVLLILFGVEAGAPEKFGVGTTATLLRGVRAVATAAIVAAGIGYVLEREWLDAINTALWAAVVLLLEVEVRRPAAVARRRTVYAATATVLYAALGALVVVWAARGEWLDAADAFLWIAAFAVIEFDLLRAAGPA